MNYRILIAEDEPKIREVLCDFFLSRGDVPVAAADGAQALELAESQEFDGVLLDIMMPKLDGLTVCRCLRKKSDVPIIFLTALSDEEDKLYGYELGGRRLCDQALYHDGTVCQVDGPYQPQPG